MASSDLTVVTSRVSDMLAVDGDAAEDRDDEVSGALLAAARQLMAAHGIRRLRMDDVAREAGYGRATLYRRFATRDELVWAVVSGEMAATLAEIEQAVLRLDALEDKLVEAFAATVEAVQQHPLLQRLLQIEPDLLLPHLTTGGAAVLGMARDHLGRLLARGQADGELGPMDVRTAADMIVRLTHSLLLTPGGSIPCGDPAALRTFARRHVAGPLMRLAGTGPTN